MWRAWGKPSARTSPPARRRDRIEFDRENESGHIRPNRFAIVLRDGTPRPLRADFSPSPGKRIPQKRASSPQSALAGVDPGQIFGADHRKEQVPVESQFLRLAVSGQSQSQQASRIPANRLVDQEREHGGHLGNVEPPLDQPRSKLAAQLKLHIDTGSRMLRSGKHRLAL